MRTRFARRTEYALALIVAVAVAVAIIALVRPDHPRGEVFPALRPAAAPAEWPRRALPNGTAVLSYPPSFHRLAGDSDAVSVARRRPSGAFLLYLNATPRQGRERLHGWAAFRLSLLRSDDAASAHQDAAAEGIKFRGGTGSCVIDDYLTRIGDHHYKEVACLVQGRIRPTASVIVAAAPAAGWAQVRPLLLRAVAAYRVHQPSTGIGPQHPGRTAASAVHR